MMQAHNYTHSIKASAPGQARQLAHEQQYNDAHRLTVEISLIWLATTLTLKPIQKNG